MGQHAWLHQLNKVNIQYGILDKEGKEDGNKPDEEEKKRRKEEKRSRKQKEGKKTGELLAGEELVSEHQMVYLLKYSK